MLLRAEVFRFLGRATGSLIKDHLLLGSGLGVQIRELVSGEGSLPGLQMAAFLLRPHLAKRDHLSLSSSFKGTNPITRTPLS